MSKVPKIEYTEFFAYILGIAVSRIIFTLVSSFFLWFLWTYCSIGSEYFFFLPEFYHRISYVGFVKISFFLVAVRIAIFPLVYRYAN